MALLVLVVGRWCWCLALHDAACWFHCCCCSFASPLEHCNEQGRAEARHVWALLQLLLVVCQGGRGSLGCPRLEGPFAVLLLLLLLVAPQGQPVHRRRATSQPCSGCCTLQSCEERRGLASFEVPFAYREAGGCPGWEREGGACMAQSGRIPGLPAQPRHQAGACCHYMPPVAAMPCSHHSGPPTPRRAGERKQALVKVRVCPTHAYQLNYRKHKVGCLCGRRCAPLLRLATFVDRSQRVHAVVTPALSDAAWQRKRGPALQSKDRCGLS